MTESRIGVGELIELGGFTLEKLSDDRFSFVDYDAVLELSQFDKDPCSGDRLWSVGVDGISLFAGEFQQACEFVAERLTEDDLMSD